VWTENENPDQPTLTKHLFVLSSVFSFVPRLVVWFMVFNVTFNNISVISLRSYFGVEQKFKMDISHGQSLYCSFMGTSLSSLGEALKRMN
jgi:hypothetical protein